MRILFVEIYVKTTEPMGIMLLSALAKQKGHQTFLHILLQGDLREALEKIKPDIVAYSAMTGDHRYFLEANKIVKNYNKSIFTIMGGKHPTFFPEILRASDLDAICIGEGDDAWPELLSVLENKGDINDISNIMTRENSAIFKLRNRCSNLDNLPFLDYDICYRNTPLGKMLKRTIMTSRGCPYSCTYCFNHIYNKMYHGKGPVVVRQSVERVIGEAKYLISHWPTKFIKFYDDDFVLKLDDWLREFSERWPEEIGLPFHCLLRANVIAREPEILVLLKKAGVKSVMMSVESGNDYVRNHLFKRNMSKDELRQAFKKCWDLGIHTFSLAILGVPISKTKEREFNLPNSLKRDIESLDINLEIHSTLAEYPILVPYPRTEIGEYCRKNGFFDGNFDNFTVSYQSKSLLTCFTLKEKMIQQNLFMLGSIIQLFSGSRNGFMRMLVTPLRWLVINCLIKLPFGKFYLIFYVLTVNYLYQAKLYRSDAFSWVGCFKNIFPLLRLNYFKQFEKTKK